MNEFSQHNDINALLLGAKESLSDIEKQYNASLHQEEISSQLLIKIKHFLEDLRSSLDYLRKKISKYNFPICETELDVENSTTDLSDSQKIIMKKWQPFNGNSWIRWFNKLNNESKHVTLIPQKRSSMVETCVTHPQGGIVNWMSGTTFGNGVSVMGIPINVTSSDFNENTGNGDSNEGAAGFLISNNGNSATVNVVSSSFNANSANGDNNAGAYGFLASNTPSATDSAGLTVSATNSQFNENSVSGVNAEGYGFYVRNSNHVDASPLSVTNLSGSTFNNNGTYGIYAIGNSSTTTTVNLFDTFIVGNPNAVGDGGDVDFTK